MTETVTTQETDSDSILPDLNAGNEIRQLSRDPFGIILGPDEQKRAVNFATMFFGIGTVLLGQVCFSQAINELRRDLRHK